MDMEMLADLNHVCIEGARAPFSVCVINVTGYAYEFDQAFVHYLATLREYKVVCKSWFGDALLVVAGLTQNKPHVARVTRLAKTCPTLLPCPLGRGVVSTHTP